MNIGLKTYARLIVIPILAVACESCQKNEATIIEGDGITQEETVNGNEHQTGSMEIDVEAPPELEDKDFTGFESWQIDSQVPGKFGYIFGDYANHRRLKKQRPPEMQQYGEQDEPPNP